MVTLRISSTEVQNNFGKYLVLATHEDIIITRNGTEVAKLTTKLQETDVVREKYEISGYGEKASYEEFLELRKHSDERYEYIDGEIYLLSSPKTAHQFAVTQLIVELSNCFQDTDCTPFVAPYDIELKKPNGEINMVQPDLMVICDLDDKLGEDDYYKGVPTLVMEVLSNSTRRKDLLIKTALYRDCGVKEYWIINPDEKQVMIYHFDQDNVEVTTFKIGEIATSYTFEELTIKVEDVFRG